MSAVIASVCASLVHGTGFKVSTSNIAATLIIRLLVGLLIYAGLRAIGLP